MGVGERGVWRKEGRGGGTEREKENEYECALAKKKIANDTYDLRV